MKRGVFLTRFGCAAIAMSGAAVLNLAAVAQTQQDRESSSRETTQRRAQSEQDSRYGQDQRFEEEATTRRSQQQRSQQARDQQARDQQARDQQARDQQARDQQARDQQARDQQARDQRSQDQRSQSERQFQLSPAGWVRVATDYNNDGQFDAVETIYFFDLEQARKSSRDRANREAQAAFEGQRQQETITGEIQSLRQEQLMDMDETCLIARIETDDGQTRTVCLGPQSKLSKLDLREGDQVAVQGTRGQINDRMMLMARQVTSDGQRVAISMPAQRRQLSRLRGEVLSHREAKFRGFDESHVVARLELQSGEEALVNLGPKSKVKQLDLQQGDQLSVLARPGWINGQPAKIAEEIEANGTYVSLTRPQDTARFERQAADPATRQREQYPVTYDGNERAALGVTLSDGSDGRVTIERIWRDTPADQSGLQQGDKILAINGQQVNTYRDVVRQMSNFQPGERIDLRIMRDGESRTINVRLSALSDTF